MRVAVPDDFAKVVASVRRGQKPRVAVRDLVRWFGFERRGAKVNRYIRTVMEQEGVVCAPDLEVPFPEGELVFSSVASPPPPPSNELPHPFAVLRQAIGAQQDITRRVGTRIDVIERTVAYLAFAELAELRDASGAYPVVVREQLRGVLPRDASPGPPLSFGTWVEHARALGRLLPKSGSPIQRAADAFDAKVASRLANETVPLRNKLKHGASLPEEWFQQAEPLLIDVDDGLQHALMPLLDLELLCVGDTRPGDREAYCYVLRMLRGVGRHFPTRELETSTKLVKRWAYLDVPGLGLLRLAPGIVCDEDRATEEVRLFFARTLALDPGQKISAQAVQGGDDVKEALPK